MRRPVALALTIGVMVSVLGAGAGLPADAFAQDSAALPAKPGADAPQLIVIGFDGLAADRVEAGMEAGRLKNFAALRKGGGYSRLATSNPAQSPVSWASIISGLNPGKTGISDFLRRPGMDPTKVTFAHAEVKQESVLTQFQRGLVVAAAAVLGAIAGVGIAFAIGRGGPAWRKGKRVEILLSGGAAVGALVAFAGLQFVPDTVPTVRNLRTGEPFWMRLDRAGIRTVSLEAPLCFPPEPMECGCAMAGLGVPDMTGTWGAFSLWTDDAEGSSRTETAGTGFFVKRTDSHFDLVIAGPRNQLLSSAELTRIQTAGDKERGLRDISVGDTKAERRVRETREQLIRLESRLTAHLPVDITRGVGAKATLQDGTVVDLRPGVWTDLLPIRFVMSPLTTLHGRVRLLLDDAGSTEPVRPFRLFVGQVQWDAAALPPNVTLSEPRTFARELAAAVGPFETIGWPEQTNAVKDDFLTDRAFVDHTYLLLKAREAKFRDRLKRGDFRLLFALFAEPDRVQHALYRHVDPKSPTYDAKQAAVFGGEIDRIYEEADRIVGDALRLAPPGAQIIVVSDHGFAPFRRGVNLNMWLRSKRYQTVTGDDTAGSVADISTGTYYSNVSWPDTKAYGFGLGGIYLNLAGREPHGSVPITQADAVLDGITKDLLALRDGTPGDGAGEGAKVVRRVYRGSEIFSGPRMAEMPDLVVGFEWGYRVSWQGTLGGKDTGIITPNMLRWSGDHCSVDPELVPGVLFSTIPIQPDVGPRVEDVAPSILARFGISADDADGTDIFAK